MVEWDRDGRVRSESIHQFGSATLDEKSPHYADQAEKLFSQSRLKPTWLQPSELEGNVESTKVLRRF